MRRLGGLFVALALAACSQSGSDADEVSFPEIVAVDVEWLDDTTAAIAVTVSSPYDTPERYADAWRVVGPDGTVHGTRELAHDHAGEQPFTRSLRPVTLPRELDEITVEGRDLVNGWGGSTLTVALPPRP